MDSDNTCKASGATRVARQSCKFLKTISTVLLTHSRLFLLPISCCFRQDFRITPTLIIHTALCLKNNSRNNGDLLRVSHTFRLLSFGLEQFSHFRVKLRKAETKNNNFGRIYRTFKKQTELKACPNGKCLATKHHHQTLAIGDQK